MSITTKSRQVASVIPFTAPLRKSIRRSVNDRPFTLKFWDGTSVEASSPDGPVITIADPDALAHIVRKPTPLGFFRGYVDGSLAIDDLDKAWRVIDDWKPPALSVGDRARVLLSTLFAAVPAGIPKRPELELILDGEQHTLDRDVKAIQYHYDVGNDFFALFLDESMTYSCAVFSKGAETLEEAQLAKLDLVATKLQLAPGMRLLDVGCGWGAFAIHAAKKYGVHVLGITLAEEQAKLATERVAAAGLSDMVEIRIADYRSLQEGSFDAISSIGMVEHVGESQINLYAKTLHDLLRPGGLLLNHGIADTRPEEYGHEDQIAMRYVFPDGSTLPLWRVEQAMQLAGMHTEHIEGFQQDYADTLKCWYQRLDQHLPEAEAIAGAARTRIWRLYLRASARSFEVGYIRVYQVLTRRPLAPVN